MPKLPRKPPQQKKNDAVVEDRVVGRAVVAKPSDPRQTGLFDQPLPKWIKPSLPTLVDKPPIGAQWVHEIKWDGYRISAYLSAGKAMICTRNGHDWTARFPAIAAALPGLKARSAVIDGEAVVLDEEGRSNFAELQAALTKHGAEAAVMYAFDLLFLDGEDLRTKPLEERRALLAPLLKKSGTILMSEEFTGAGADLFRVACEHELEGIVSKRLDVPYRSGRVKTWLKTKCVQSDAFVIVGYQP
ncbi:RNA ligase family protein, partial [Beijerinckia sp. L45]|uniref:ATP-dependent DNA ligase n=1 Tax=Beijerinckia sp. L45 TaxID=1641855 RepID=UPI00131C055C